VGEKQLEPIPGESRFDVIVTAVMTAMLTVPLITLLILWIWVPGLGSAVAIIAPLAALATFAFLLALRSRREYLRKIRNGTVIVRQPWKGPDAPYTG
jgi:ABC-type proline/glycine betaine transport system permease subunit